jgi:oxygen-dependent protoporphyrinogen oxidase
MTDYDLLIVGAGIAGLSMAHYAAAAGLKARVLERESQAGGCLHSHRFTGEQDGFWLELGAHSSFNSYGNLLAILERIGLFQQLQRRAKVSFRLFAEDAAHSIASQLHVSELLLAPFRSLRTPKAGRSVADYFGHIVGPRNYRAVFEPTFNAVICQPSGDFPADALFRSRPRRKDAPRGFTVPGGLQTIADYLSQQPGIAVTLGQPVRAIRRDGAVFIVHTDSGDYRARAVSLATPVAVAAELLQAEFSGIAAALAQIETATVESVGVAIPAALLRLPPVAGLIGRDQAFYSAVSRDTVPHPLWRGFTFHFRPGAVDDEAKLARISQVLGVPRPVLGAANTVFRINQLPALRVGHGDRIRAVDQALAGTGLALSGNYFTGVAIEDCVSRSLSEFERLQQECGWKQ